MTWLAILSHRLRDREGLPRAGDVVDAQEGCTAPGRLDRQPDRRRIATTRLLGAGQPAYEALARRTDQHGIAALGQPAGAGDQVDVLLHALAEAQAGIQGDALAVDIDGDKVMEQFPLAGILDGVRSPAKEWSAAPVVGAKCTPAFQLFDLKLVPKLEAGKGSADQHVIGLDVLGVADLDADGRNEIVLAFKFPTVRTIVVYSPAGSAQRLELVGEGQAFPR